MAKKEKPFHNPFVGLKLKPAEPAAKGARPAKPPPAPTAKTVPAPADGDDEGALFRAMIGAVEPVRSGPSLIPPPPPPPAEALRIFSAEEEALLELCELVASDGPLDVSHTDEWTEAGVPGLDPRILRRLRDGGYAVQAHLDLHGMIKDEAKEALGSFVAASHRKGLRCVLVIHGRGLHSKDQLPVLKEAVPGWLTRGRIAHQVLAFATARPHDGGAGALYVLLRR